MNFCNSLDAIKQFFYAIKTSNNPVEIKTHNCQVTYSTDIGSFNFILETHPVTVNITNRNYYSVYIGDLNSDDYHTEFQSDYQNFWFDKNTQRLIIGKANNKQFSEYQIEIQL